MSTPPAAPRVDVVGMGPAGPEHLTASALELAAAVGHVVLRTSRHPAAIAFPGAPSFDDVYERAETFDDVYRTIVEEVLEEARRTGRVVYAVPGSPTVAERTVVLLRAHPTVTSGEVALVVHPALSFADLAFERLGVDPLASGVRLVDGESFAVEAAGERGPLLVGQCWSTAVLSGIKLAAEPGPGARVIVLSHLGLDDERIREVPWEELDRTVEPDHLTSLWIPELAAPVARELAALEDLVRTLRERCPWDRRQTHGSLARHLLEESYETLEAIDAIAALDEAADGGDGGDEVAVVEHLEEELGDLLFQVYFHATLAAEEGRFTLADVARRVHDKLVSRHPHVFGDVSAATAEQVASNWEELKQAEKGRSSVTEGIPAALPALAVTAKLQRKATALGLDTPSLEAEAAQIEARVTALANRGTVGEPGGAPTGGEVRAVDRAGAVDGEGGARALADEVGGILFALVDVARRLGVDPENALRSRASAFRAEIERAETNRAGADDAAGDPDGGH